MRAGPLPGPTATARRLSAVALGVLALAATLLGACDGGDDPPPGVTPSSAASTSTEAPADADVEATVREIAAALDTARGLHAALLQAANEPTWDRVDEACRPYPPGARDPALGTELVAGLQSKSPHPELWPEPVVAVDAAAAQTCFIIEAAHAIPPNKRIDATSPTTAEIASQSLAAALDDLDDTSPQALRDMIERMRRG